MNETEKQQFESLKREVAALWLRFLAVENRKETDYSKIFAEINREIMKLGEYATPYSAFIELESKVRLLEKLINQSKQSSIKWFWQK